MLWPTVGATFDSRIEDRSPNGVACYRSRSILIEVWMIFLICQARSSVFQVSRAQIEIR